jgi:hypothetical protein
LTGLQLPENIIKQLSMRHGLASGIYVSRLEFDGKMQMNKMLMVR